MTLDISRARLVAATLLRRFPADQQIKRRQFDFEDKFTKEFGAVLVTNVPENAPDNAALFMMTDGTKQFLVSRTSTQANLRFSQEFMAGKNIMQMLSRYAILMDAGLDSILGYQTRAFVSIGITIEIPYDVTEEVEIAKQLEKECLVWDLPNPRAVHLNIAVSDGDRERTGNFLQYRRMNAAVTPETMMMGFQPFADIDYGPIQEYGFQVRVEVNTKPQKDTPTQGMFRREVEAMTAERMASVIPASLPILSRFM